MPISLAAFTLAAAPAFAQDPAPVPSAIVEVTVYPGAASVRRRAELPAVDGRYVLAGLPAGLDPDGVRVRLAGGEVVGVEARERLQPAVSDERVEDLRGRIRALERELAGLDDQGEVLRALLEHVQRLLRQEEGVHAGDVAQGRANPESWEANFRYLSGKLRELKEAARALEPERDETRRALEDLRLQLGRFESAGPVARKDLIVDVVGAAGGAARTLEVEYIVAGAGWEPYYDLRARKDLSAVELSYRARVQQSTGEDWRDAEVLLSTAQPQRGAQGPGPRPIWLSLADPKAPARGRALEEAEALRSLGYSGDDAMEAPALDAAAPPAFAAVEREGLSVRFRLPRKETIESRPEPTSVLVGRAELALSGEHRVVPALDPTVWLRAKARNTSEWLLLPGRAAVYFGADFVGHSYLEAVQPGQELELSLGADPGVTVTRTLLQDLHEGAGVFSSRATHRESWRIELENHGAFTPSPDGSVEIVVQEVLPKPRDERIKVEIDSVKPKLAEGEPWAKEREETGALTWVVRVPKGGKTTLELVTEVSFPESLKLIRR